MKTRLLRCLALCFTCFASAFGAIAPPGLTEKEVAQGFRERRVLAKPRATQLATLDAAEASEGFRLRRKFTRFGNLRVLDLEDDDSVDRAIARLRATQRYEYVEPDLIRRGYAVPNDPSFNQQWALRNTGQNGGTPGADIAAAAGWDTTTSASSVIVAVIDSGIRLTHQDLAANLWSSPTGSHGIDSLVSSGSAGYTNPADDDGHGTHVSGIVGAVGNNGAGVSGVAWSTKLMALKFLSGENKGSVADSIECIEFALANGAKIINASYGNSGYSQAEYTAIRAARDAGVIFVAAAGNDALNNDTVLDYPSGYPLDNIVAVAASTRTDTLASYSNHGAGSVDLAAPGSDIYSTTFSSDSSYGMKSGTSMAAPHVAGALALLKGRFPNETYRELINRLLRSTTRLPALEGRVHTSGRLNLAQLLASADNRPFNDHFAERAIVTGANIRIRSNNLGASIESGEPLHAGLNATRSLWWSWTAPASTSVSFDTAGSAYDTVLAVYTGTAPDNLQTHASNDNASGSVTSSRLVMNVTGGTTYHFAVAGKTAGGFTTVRIGAVPPNDSFATAKTLIGENIRELGSTLNASRETGEPNPNNAGAGHSVWYRWTAPASGRYSLAAFATTNDTVAAVFTGSSVSDLSLVAANNNSSPQNSDALVPFNAEAGVTYSFLIDHASADSAPDGGDFVLTLTDSAWQFPAGDEITSSPAVGSDGTIYFGAGSSDGHDTKIYAINANGTSKWTYLTGDDGIIGASPALAADGTVYIGGTDKILYALNGATGARKWSYTAATMLTSTPAIATDGTVYFRDDTKLYALTSAGSLKWTFPLSGSTEGTYGSPVIALDGTIYVGTNSGRLHAITDQGTSAASKWTYSADGDIYTSPALAADGTIYFATLNGKVYALTDHGGSATVKWSWSTPASSSITSSIALGTDGSLYFAAYDRQLYALSSSGTLKWAFTMADEVRASSPAVAADGTIYVGCYDSHVYAINPNGTFQRSYATAGIVRSSPAIANNRLYFGSADAKLYAFDLGQTAASSDWPMFHRNAARDGRATSRTFSITTQPQSQSIAPGSSFSLSVTTSTSTGVSYQWSKDGASLAGATSATYTVSNATSAHAGTYTVVVSSSTGSVTSSPAVISIVVAVTGGSRIVDLSARGHVGTGDGVLIAGVVLGGSPAKSLLVRGVGPSLLPLGVNNALLNPELKIVSLQTGATLASNDDWGNQSAITSMEAVVGATPPLATGSRDAAILTAPLGDATNVFTAQISGVGGTTGVALAEIYDTNIASGARLIAISARCHVGTGENVLIGGFVIVGPSPMRILLRAVGPTLATQGVSGALVDPRLDLFRHANGVNTVIASNDNWDNDATIAATSLAVGNNPPLTASSKDAALLLTLEPGIYSAQVSGVGGTTGVALVEIYEVP